MKKFTAIMLLLFPLFVWASVASHIRVADPYVRATPPGQKNTAAYVELGYEDSHPASIVAVYTPIAKKAQMHTVEEVKGVAKMMQVSHIQLKPGSTTSLQPGGYHIMLMGLSEDLMPDDAIPLVFIYDDGSSTLVDAVVKDIRGGHSH